MLIKTWQNGFKDQEIDENDIVYFAIVNRVSFTNKGTFKKFIKVYQIQVKDELIRTTEDTIKSLKESLKGKYTVSKYTVTKQKGLDERKATDWTFRMIK